MPNTATVNGVRLSYELAGSGPIPLVLVHGSWVSQRGWNLVVPGLARQFRVLTYDRRGHSSSERPAGQGSVLEDVADLAALLRHLGLTPAFVAGNSFGASIALRFAGLHPDLVRGLIAHEPPLFHLLAGDPSYAPMLDEIQRRVGAVARRIAGGDHEGAAEQFVDTVALGPGMWARLPPENRKTMIDNAPTFLDEIGDPEALAIDLDSLRRFEGPALLSHGGQSPPTFAPVIRTLAAALPHAELQLFEEAGHAPHLTSADAYVDVVTAFIRRHLAEKKGL